MYRVNGQEFATMRAARIAAISCVAIAAQKDPTECHLTLIEDADYTEHEAEEMGVDPLEVYGWDPVLREVVQFSCRND